MISTRHLAEFISAAGPQTVTCSGISSAESFGSSRLNFTIYPASVISEEQFGAAQFNFRINPASITSVEALGSLLVNLVILPSSINSEEAFGSSQLVLIIRTLAVSSEEAFGSHLVSGGVAQVFAVGIDSGEALGAVLIGMVGGDSLSVWALTREELLTVLEMMNA